MGMVLTKRTFFAGLCASVIAANILVYIYSFFGAPVDRILPWMVPLVLGLMVLAIPVMVDSPGFRSWRNFTRPLSSLGAPGWADQLCWILLLFAIGSLVWAAVQGGWGVPAIIDGQYVSDARGHILKVLTQEEYFKLKEAELRVFTAFMVGCYFVPMMYWCYRRPTTASA